MDVTNSRVEEGQEQPEEQLSALEKWMNAQKEKAARRSAKPAVEQRVPVDIQRSESVLSIEDSTTGSVKHVYGGRYNYAHRSKAATDDRSMARGPVPPPSGIQSPHARPSADEGRSSDPSFSGHREKSENPKRSRLGKSPPGPEQAFREAESSGPSNATRTHDASSWEKAATRRRLRPSTSRSTNSPTSSFVGSSAPQASTGDSGSTFQNPFASLTNELSTSPPKDDKDSESQDQLASVSAARPRSKGSKAARKKATKNASRKAGKSVKQEEKSAEGDNALWAKIEEENLELYGSATPGGKTSIDEPSRRRTPRKTDATGSTQSTPAVSQVSSNRDIGHNEWIDEYAAQVKAAVLGQIALEAYSGLTNDERMLYAMTESDTEYKSSAALLNLPFTGMNDESKELMGRLTGKHGLEGSIFNTLWKSHQLFHRHVQECHKSDQCQEKLLDIISGSPSYVRSSMLDVYSELFQHRIPAEQKFMCLGSILKPIYLTAGRNPKASTELLQMSWIRKVVDAFPEGEK